MLEDLKIGQTGKDLNASGGDAKAPFHPIYRQFGSITRFHTFKMAYKT